LNGCLHWTFYTDFKNVPFDQEKGYLKKVLPKKNIFLGHGQFFDWQNSFWLKLKKNLPNTHHALKKKFRQKAIKVRG
jgi:hypothetical protein